MIFNFVLLHNHHETSLSALGDLLEPIYLGLEECGHDVVRFGLDLMAPPAINVLVEFFSDDRFVDYLAARKHEGLLIGLLCTEDPSDKLVMDVYANRLPNMNRVAQFADFVWTLLPIEDHLRRVIAHDRVSLIRYGYCAGLDRARFIDKPALRDIDALIYGNALPRRNYIVNTLKTSGLVAMTTRREYYPEYLSTDLLRRSKVVLDIARAKEVRYLSPTRLNKALHCGSLVISERYDTSSLAYFYDYTITGTYQEMIGLCRDAISNRDYIELGRANKEKFRNETSMAGNLRDAISATVERL